MRCASEMSAAPGKNGQAHRVSKGLGINFRILDRGEYSHPQRTVPPFVNQMDGESCRRRILPLRRVDADAPEIAQGDALGMPVDIKTTACQGIKLDLMLIDAEAPVIIT